MAFHIATVCQPLSNDITHNLHVHTHSTPTSTLFANSLYSHGGLIKLTIAIRLAMSIDNHIRSNVIDNASFDWIPFGLNSILILKLCVCAVMVVYVLVCLFVRFVSICCACCGQRAFWPSFYIYHSMHLSHNSEWSPVSSLFCSSICFTPLLRASELYITLYSIKMHPHFVIRTHTHT